MFTDRFVRGASQGVLAEHSAGDSLLFDMVIRLDISALFLLQNYMYYRMCCTYQFRLFFVHNGRINAIHSTKVYMLKEHQTLVIDLLPLFDQTCLYSIAN